MLFTKCEENIFLSRENNIGLIVGLILAVVIVIVLVLFIVFRIFGKTIQKALGNSKYLNTVYLKS